MYLIQFIALMQYDNTTTFFVSTQMYPAESEPVLDREQKPLTKLYVILYCISQIDTSYNE